MRNLKDGGPSPMAHDEPDHQLKTKKTWIKPRLRSVPVLAITRGSLPHNTNDNPIFPQELGPS
ncbi:MAG: hypothetical protein AAGA00_06910 [Pseudomonadota bacterium]